MVETTLPENQNSIEKGNYYTTKMQLRDRMEQK